MICVDKLVDHPYFTRFKSPKDSFLNQICKKEKTTMRDNNDDIDMNDVIVAQPAAADKNELIMQLMQQIAEMSVEIQRMQDLYNPISSFNPPRDGRPPLHFPPQNAEQVQNILSNPTQILPPLS